MPDFAAAADRHYRDAKALADDGRHPSADHLAGFAAECALKEILTQFLGAVLSSSGQPMTPPGNKTKKYGHLPDLWSDVAASATGRVAPAFLALIVRPNPFARWDVADRYEDGSAIDAARVRDHLMAAATVISVYRQAVIDGALP